MSDAAELPSSAASDHSQLTMLTPNSELTDPCMRAGCGVSCCMRGKSSQPSKLRWFSEFCLVSANPAPFPCLPPPLTQRQGGGGVAERRERDKGYEV
eukprot:4639939-Pyramimonas_sp.AAC.1